MADLAKLALFLGEKNDKTGVFLKTLNEFRKQFLFTVKQCKERKKRELEKEKRERWKQEKLKKKGGGGAGGKKPPPIKAKSTGIGMGLPPPVDEEDDGKEDGMGGLPP